MISNFKKNCMGTVSFDAKFPGMGKAQDFIVYPLSGEADGTKLTIQSDTRIGEINLTSGWVTLSNAHANGAYQHHLMLEGSKVEKLNAEDLLMLKAHVMGTASEKAGTNGIVYCDNSKAAEVFK